MLYVTAFMASLVFVFLKALQQRNVAFNNYWWVLPTSLAMASAEVYIVVIIAGTGGWEMGLVLAIGTGAGIGALGAMLFHERFVRNGFRWRLT